MRLSTKTNRILTSCGYRLAECDRNWRRGFRRNARARINRYLSRISG